MKILFQKTPLSEVQTNVWKKALQSTKKDTAVGIAHAEVCGNSEYRIHIAAISKKVACHFHQVGNEDYRIVSGTGVLHWGRVNHAEVSWEEAISVRQKDSFTIPEQCAHQLENTGPEDLIILFGCPDTHLTSDRTFLADCQEVAK